MNSIYLPRSKKIIFPLILIFLSFMVIGIILLGVDKFTILIAGLLVSVVILSNPFIGLLILVFLEPLSQLIFLPGFGSLGKILGIYTVFVWLLSKLVYKKNIKTNRVFWLALAFFLWGSLSILWAENPIISLAFIYRLMRYIGIYLLMINFLDSEKRFNWVIFAFISGCFIMNILGIKSFLGGETRILTRMSLGGQNPNVFGVILGIAILCLWYFLNSNSIKYINKFFIFLLEIFFFVGFILAQSRGAWITFIICISYSIILTKKRKRINLKNALVVIIFLILIIIIVFSVILHFFPEKIEYITDRALTIYFSPEKALGSRISYWKAGLERWSENPIFGLGIDNFFSIHHFNAHSVYIAIICELGIVGFIIWLFLIFSLFKIIKSNTYRPLTICIFLFLLIISFKGNYYKIPFYWYMFGIISATSFQDQKIIKRNLEKGAIATK